MKVEYRGSIKVLAADEGKKITNGDKSFFSDFIYLGKNDSPDNYEEVPRTIWKHFVEDKSTDFDILSEMIVDSKIYELLKKKITRNAYSTRESMQVMLDVYYFSERITETEYEELTKLLV